MYSSTDAPEPDDPRQRPQKLSATRKQTQEYRKKNRERVLKAKARRKKAKARIREMDQRTKERIKAQRNSPEAERHEKRQKLKALRKSKAQVSFERKARRERTRTKGSMQTRSGVHDVDILRSDRWENVNLDSGAQVLGRGKFVEGKYPSLPGAFIPDHSLGTEGFGEEHYDEQLECYVGGPPDEGPVCYGGHYVQFGRGRRPGTDIRRYDQMVNRHRDRGPVADGEDGWRRSHRHSPLWALKVPERVIDWRATIWGNPKD